MMMPFQGWMGGQAGGQRVNHQMDRQVGGRIRGQMMHERSACAYDNLGTSSPPVVVGASGRCHSSALVSEGLL